MLVCPGCHNKILRLSAFNNRNLSLTLSETRCWQGWFLFQGLLPSSHCVFTDPLFGVQAERESERLLSDAFSWKGTNPMGSGPTLTALISSFKTPSPDRAPCWVRTSGYEFLGDTNIQSIIIVNSEKLHVEERSQSLLPHSCAWDMLGGLSRLKGLGYYQSRLKWATAIQCSHLAL